MSKASKINKAIDYIALAGGAYFAAITIAGAIKRKRAQSDPTSGIGDLTAWNKRHLADYFERSMWGGMVVVNLGAIDKRGYFPVDFHTSDHRFKYPNFTYLVSPKNINYLKDLCRIYHCAFKVEDGEADYPNVYKV